MFTGGGLTREITVTVWIAGGTVRVKPQKEIEMEYHDKLVQITEEYILFHHYYFPFGSKQIRMDQIKDIKVLAPTLVSGKYRIHGTGDLRTWFPRDAKRSDRDRIFVITQKKGWVRIGFTVEQSNLALLIFEKLGLLID